uniref:MARVEL domain-containing protein n=1 Tax=Steinernema glaseri TaxID=37863 RepID=A0A1I7YEY6_9BILA
MGTFISYDFSKLQDACCFRRKFHQVVALWSAQVLSLAVYIALFFPDYHYTGTGFVNFLSLNALLYSTISLICHMLGVHRRTFQVGNNFVFIPFTICDFISSIIFLFGYGISALICILSMLDGLRFVGNIFVTFLILSLLCIASGAAFGYFAILIYRNCPNGRIANLTGMITEGDGLTSAELRTNDSSDSTRPPV